MKKITMLGLLIVWASVSIVNGNGLLYQPNDDLDILVKTNDKQYSAGDDGLTFSVTIINRTDKIKSLPASLRQHEDGSNYFWPVMSFSLIRIHDDGSREDIVNGYSIFSYTHSYKDTVRILPHDSMYATFKYYNIGGGGDDDRKKYITPGKYIIDATGGIGDMSKWSAIRDESNLFEYKPVKPLKFVQVRMVIISRYLWVNKRNDQYELFNTYKIGNDSSYMQDLTKDTLNQKVYLSQKMVTTKDLIEPLDVAMGIGNYYYLWSYPSKKETVLRISNSRKINDNNDIKINKYLDASMRPRIKVEGEKLKINYQEGKIVKEYEISTGQQQYLKAQA